MSDELTPGDDDMPDDNVIMEEWISVKEAAKIIGITEAGVSYALINGLLRGKKYGEGKRGFWKVDPEAARNYQSRSRND